MTVEKSKVSAADATRNFNVILRRLALQPGQRVELRDDDVSGLILRVAADGTASWNVRTRTQQGKQTRVKIADYPSLGLAQARTEARKLLARIATGGDPVMEKREARAARGAKQTEPTLAERFREWIEVRESDKTRPLADRTASEYRRSFERDILPRLGGRPLREIEREDWASVIASKRRTAPAMASLLYRVASAFLSHAEAHGWVDGHPLPRKGLATLAPPPKARRRTLSDDELADLLHASDELSAKARAFVRLLALTGARETQVATVKVGAVDKEAGLWRLPAEQGSKNYQERTVPLGSLALEALDLAWPSEDVDGDYRLLGAVDGGAFQGFSKLKARVDALIAQRRAKIAAETGATIQPMPAWRWHDLRRSVRSGLAAMGVAREVAELAVGHISGRSTLERTYDQHSYEDETRAALLRWQSHVEDLLRTEGPTLRAA